MAWFEIKYNPTVLGLRTKVLNISSGEITEDLESFLTYRGELGIRYGFVPGPVFLSDNWTLLEPNKYQIVQLSPENPGGIENITQVYERYQTWDFVELTIYPSDIKTSKLFPTGDEAVGEFVGYSEALVPAYDREDSEERFRLDLLSGFLRVFSSGSFKIYIPKVPKTWCIYLRGRKKESSFVKYVGSIGVSEVDLTEGSWYTLTETFILGKQILTREISPFYWDPGIIRVALVRLTYISLLGGYDALGLGSLGIDRETWDRFKLLYSTYEEEGNPVLVVSLSGWLRDEISNDLEIAKNIKRDLESLEWFYTKF